MVEQDSVLYEIDSEDAAANIEKAQISLSQAQRSYESTAENQTVKQIPPVRCTHWMSKRGTRSVRGRPSPPSATTAP